MTGPGRQGQPKGEGQCTEWTTSNHKKLGGMASGTLSRCLGMARGNKQPDKKQELQLAFLGYGQQLVNHASAKLGQKQFPAFATFAAVLAAVLAEVFATVLAAVLVLSLPEAYRSSDGKGESQSKPIVVNPQNHGKT